MRSCCFVEAKNWDIETLETALESSESVLLQGRIQTNGRYRRATYLTPIFLVLFANKIEIRNVRSLEFEPTRRKSTDSELSNAVSNVSISHFLAYTAHIKGTS